MGSEMKYWFATHNIGGVESQINKIISCYNELTRNAMAISSVMTEYINTPGKWNDDNSIVVAKWWNRDGKESGTGGELQSTSEGLKIIGSATGGVYDGEDRIRGILNRSAYLFWVVICRQLYSVVTNQYEQIQGNLSPMCRKFIEKGNDGTYVSASGNFTSNIWDNIMNDFISDSSSMFKNTMLPVQNTIGGSSDVEIINFMQNINNRIQNFLDSLNHFVMEIRKIMNDTPNSSEFFGFEPNIEAQNACENLIKISNSHIENFQKNLSTAISTYSGDVSKQISQYLSTKYIMN